MRKRRQKRGIRNGREPLRPTPVPREEAAVRYLFRAVSHPLHADRRQRHLHLARAGVARVERDLAPLGMAVHEMIAPSMCRCGMKRETWNGIDRRRSCCSRNRRCARQSDSAMINVGGYWMLARLALVLKWADREVELIRTGVAGVLTARGLTAAGAVRHRYLVVGSSAMYSRVVRVAVVGEGAAMNEFLKASRRNPDNTSSRRCPACSCPAGGLAGVLAGAGETGKRMAARMAMIACHEQLDQ